MVKSNAPSNRPAVVLAHTFVYDYALAYDGYRYQN